MAIPVGYAQVVGRITLTGSTREMAVVYGIDIDSPPFTQAQADAVSTATGTFLKNCMATMYTYVGARIFVGNDPGSIIFESSSGAGAGTNGASAVPQNAAYLFRKSSGMGGRRNRGRMFVPGVSESLVDNAGNVSSGEVTSLNGRAAALLTALNTAGTPMVLLHSEAPFTPSTVSSMVAQPQIATQRRRLR